VIVYRGKRLGLHDIGVETAVEMIDLVLQNPRIPAGRFDYPLLPMFVEEGHSNGARPRYHCHQSRDAETAFIEENIGGCEQIYLRIDDCGLMIAWKLMGTRWRSLNCSAVRPF
jgi:hypothetical protein